ncbi:MAG: hypothetical protein JWN50_378 [Parcubacteria group bacterium]|nr:hypothetical protein [Parcubacteria group bacterium]
MGLHTPISAGLDDEYQGYESMPDILARLREIGISRSMTLEETIVWILSDETARQKDDCPTLEELGAEWPKLSCDHRDHIRSCKFCQTFALLAFPFITDEPEEGVTERFEDERRSMARSFATCKNVVRPLYWDSLQRTPVPFMNADDPHVQTCGYCQLLLQYYDKQRMRFGFVNMDDWWYYPVFSQGDEQHVLNRIQGDEHERYWPLKRFRMNVRRDSESYRSLKEQPEIRHRLRASIRKFTRPIGSFITGWRSISTPFPKRHPWAYFTPTDRLTKLLMGKNLVPEEVLYKAVLDGAMQVEEALEKLESMLPLHDGYEWTPHGQTIPLGTQITKLWGAVVLDRQAEKNGTTLEAESEKDKTREHNLHIATQTDMWHDSRVKDHFERYTQIMGREPPACLIRSAFIDALPDLAEEDGEEGPSLIHEALAEAAKSMREHALIHGQAVWDQGSPFLIKERSGKFEPTKILFDKLEELSEHIKACPECQLILAAHWDTESEQECLSYVEFLLFPELLWQYRKGDTTSMLVHLKSCERCRMLVTLFGKSPEDLSPEHIASCTQCQERIANGKK